MCDTFLPGESQATKELWMSAMTSSKHKTEGSLLRERRCHPLPFQPAK